MKTMQKGLILFVMTSAFLGFSQSSNQEKKAPELVVPQFDFEGNSNSNRNGNSNEEAKDLLSELEGLLENPAERDAKSQLGIPQEAVEKPAPKVVEVAPEPAQKTDVAKPTLPPEPPITIVPKLVNKSDPEKKLPRKAVAKVVPAKKPVPAINEMVGLDFSTEEKNQKLILNFKSPVKFRLIPKKASKQLLYVFEKTKAPKNLKRTYDARDFKSNIASYKVTESVRKKIPTLFLQIQMRNFSVPKANQSSKKLVLDFQYNPKSEGQRLLASELPTTSFGEDAFDSGKGYQGEPIEKLELKNTDVGEAIKLVTRSSGYNIVLGDDVKGNVGSLSLQNVPWDQAFHIILQMKNLGFVRKGNLLRVASLDTLKAEQESKEKQEELEPLKTVLIPVSYAKANTLSPRAAPFLSKRGKVDVDDRTNTLIVRDSESVINRLQKLFSVLDTQPPMISISAKFVEVKKSFQRTLGLATGTSSLNLAGQTSGINFGSPQAPVNAGGLIANPSGGTINLSAPKFAALNAQLAVAETQSKAKSLSNPTIVVQQGQSGNITQGKTFTQPQATIANAPGAVSTSLSVTTSLSLTVTPVVANDGSISIDTQINDADGGPNGGGSQGFTTSNRSLQTQIILQNGDTAVLGGITRGSESSSSGGVPFLKDLPLLGYFFGQNADTTDQTEVLIFITARILNPEAAFKQTL